MYKNKFKTSFLKGDDSLSMKKADKKPFDVDIDDYGGKIRELRISRGLTQNDIAGMMHVTPGYISNIENGRTSMSLRMLIYFAKAMDMSLDALVANIDPEYQVMTIDKEILDCISKMSNDDKVRLHKTLKLWIK